MSPNRISTFFEKRTRVVLVTIGATIALAAGGLASYWVVTQRRPAIASLPVGSDLVPQDALMTLTFSTDTEQWQELRQFGTPETQKQLDERLAEWRDRLLTDYGYRYERDIQPWIGDEATLAVLTEATSTETAEPVQPDSQSFALILPIDDVVQAQAILSEAQGGSDRSWTVRDYNGGQIRETEVKGRNLSVTVLDNRFVVLSEDEAAIEQVIDTHRDGESVADTPGYRQAIADVASNEPFLRLYVNAPVARSLVTANTIQPIPTPGFSPLKNNQGIAATLTLEEDKIQIQGVGWLPSDSEQRYQVKNNATEMPTLLPEETLMMVSGGNLQQFWQEFSQGSAADPKSLGNPALLREAIQSTTGLDLDQDLLAWMDGEFSMALIADPTQSSTVRTAGVVFMVKTSDRDQADAALKRLDAVMGDRYQFEVKDTNIGGESVVQWVSPFASLTVTRGWMSQNVAFLAIGAPVAETILPKPTANLSQSALFQEATQGDRDDSNGYFFLNLEQLLGTSGSLPIPNLPQNGETYAKAIRAIGIKALIQNESSTRYDISVLMRKTENPRPLPSPKE
ncbi:MAG: DUF3352 domain-containing protein [Oculatellaceae cyanobacterium bins.114]|nr:DUF3352 domain-containing protein [Oculatellaceae cyanobacterium bins.114]